MIAVDKKAQAAGWDGFWGAVNHQGDFYDSTVAAVPFLVEALNHPEVPSRAAILNYFRDRWLDAPQYGGDPMLGDPPGGADESTPMLTDAEFVATANQAVYGEGDNNEEKEFDTDSYRRMDLCAWQTGRAIQAGQPTFESLLEDPNREVATAAAEMLLVWPATRCRAKRTLVRAIDQEGDAVEQARRILELGVYGDADDEASFIEWVAPNRSGPMRAAAALTWAWVVNPAPVPESAAVALSDCSLPNCDAFAKLPWAGVYHRGPWILPPNAAELILRLANHRDNELRWRAVQGLAAGRETAKHLATPQVVPVLVARMSDADDHVRDAAAFALSQRGEAVLDICPNVVPTLMHTLQGGTPSACGHAARLLAILAHRLTPAQRREALAGIKGASGRFASKEGCYVNFDSMGIEAG
jgi:hypothetical protein